MLLPKFFLNLFLYLDKHVGFKLISYSPVDWSPLMYFYTFTIWNPWKKEWFNFGLYNFTMYKWKRYGYFFFPECSNN